MKHGLEQMTALELATLASQMMPTASGVREATERAIELLEAAMFAITGAIGSGGQEEILGAKTALGRWSEREAAALEWARTIKSRPEEWQPGMTRDEAFKRLLPGERRSERRLEKIKKFLQHYWTHDDPMAAGDLLGKLEAEPEFPFEMYDFIRSVFEKWYVVYVSQTRRESGEAGQAAKQAKSVRKKGARKRGGQKKRVDSIERTFVSRSSVSL